MMYYHIQFSGVERTSGRRINAYEYDIDDKDKLKSMYVVAYVREDEVHIQGYRFSKKDISRVRIAETDIRISEWVESKNTIGKEPDKAYPVDSVSVFHYRENDITSVLIAEVNEENRRYGEKLLSDTVIDRSKVFIVHGHDREAMIEVARFIEKIELQPIILNEQENCGDTIIEKIEKYSDVGYAVILYTKCDIGYNKDFEEQKKFRARQNVVFEHGYFIGRLGRKNVSALKKGDIETPSDISGIVYIEMDSGSGWKFDLGKELIAAGYNIDFNLALK